MANKIVLKKKDRTKLVLISKAPSCGEQKGVVNSLDVSLPDQTPLGDFYTVEDTGINNTDGSPFDSTPSVEDYDLPAIQIVHGETVVQTFGTEELMYLNGMFQVPVDLSVEELQEIGDIPSYPETGLEYILILDTSVPEFRWELRDSDESGQTRLISGSASWSGVGLIFDVSHLIFEFDGVLDTADATQVTSSPADLTDPRIDAIIVDSDGLVSILTGTPGSNPVSPTIGEDQILVSYVNIAAGATTPEIDITTIWTDDLPADWNVTIYRATSFDDQSTDDPFEGTYCLSLVGDTSYSFSNLALNATASLEIGFADVLSFRVRLDLIEGNKTEIRVKINTVNGNSSWIEAPVNKVLTGWQLVNMPISSFGVQGEVEKVVFRRLDKGNAPFDELNFSLDVVQIQQGFITPNNGVTFAEIEGDPTDNQALVDWGATLGGGGAVDSVNGDTGVVVLDADDIDDTATTHKFATAAELVLIASALQSGDNISELTNDSGYLTSAPVSSVNGDTGVVVLDTDDISEGANKYVSAAEKLSIGTALQPSDNISELTNDEGYITESDVINTSRAYTKGQAHVDVPLSIVAGNVALDLTLGNSFTLDLDEDAELQLPTVDRSQSVRIIVTNNGGFELTFETGYKVVGDAPSTTDGDEILINMACTGNDEPWLVVNNPPA